MASTMYTAFKTNLGKGVFDLTADTLKCLLLASSHTPDAANAVLADIVASEVSGTGYTAGGQALTGVTWAASGTKAILNAATASWTSATITARYAAVYAEKTVGGVVNPLICLLDFGEEKGVSGGTFSVDFDDTNGIAYIN